MSRRFTCYLPTPRRVFAALAAWLACVLVASCGSQPSLSETSPIVAVEVDGPGTVGLSLRDVVDRGPAKGIVVYFHGMGQYPDVIEKNPSHRAMFAQLMRAGYAVVAADAGGDAFANPASLDDYRELIAAAEARYHAEPVLFVAESMGALASLALLAEDHARQILGMVGITPLMGLPPAARTASFVVNAWQGAAPASADPMEWPPTSLAGRQFLLFQADGDQVIPAGATATDFAGRFDPVATVKVIDCPGGHVAAACYDGAELMTWMGGLRADRGG